MSFILSIEEIERTFSSSSTVDLGLGQTRADCVPFMTWQRTEVSGGPAADNGGLNLLMPEFIDNAGNDALRVTRGYTLGSNSVSYACYVVEFGSDCIVGQESIGSWSDAGPLVVDLGWALSDINKTFCVFYGRREGSGDDYNDLCVSAKILSATGGSGGVGQVELERGTGANAEIIGTLYVVEDTGTNFDVQHGDSALTQGTSNSDVINEVTMAESFIIATTRTNQGDDDVESAAIRVDLEDSTHVRAIRGDSGSSVWIQYQVVELTNGNVYRGLIDFTTTEDQKYSATFTTVDTDVSMASITTRHSNGFSKGYDGDTNGNDVPGTYIKAKLYSATQLVADRLSFNDNSVQMAYEVIEWESGAVPKVVSESLTTAVTTDKEITKTAVITEGPTTAVSTDKSVTKITSVEGSATTAITTDKETLVVKDVDGESTTVITTDKSVTKEAVVEKSLTTAVATDKSLTKETEIFEGSIAIVATDKSVTKVTSVEGSATTAITTDKEALVVKTAEGSATTAITTDKEITKDAVVAGELTTAVTTDDVITKIASVEGETTTAITTDELVTKDKEAEGSVTTAVSTDKSVTKETSIEESSTTGITTDKNVTKVTSVEGSATTAITTDKEALVVKTVEGEATTAVTTDKEITKDAVVAGELTTAVTTDKEVEKLGDLYAEGETTTAITTDKSITKDAVVAGAATTGITTDKSVTAIKYVEGSATTGVGTSILTSKETNAIGVATTAVLTGKSFTKVTGVEGSTTTNVQTDYDIGKGAQGPFPVTIHEVYAKTRLAEVLAKTSIGEVRFKT